MSVSELHTYPEYLQSQYFLPFPYEAGRTKQKNDWDKNTHLCAWFYNITDGASPITLTIKDELRAKNISLLLHTPQLHLKHIIPLIIIQAEKNF